ncbi:hypothetical protein ACFL55_03330 [Candidatus Latescibacterota bacterium]
MDVPEHPDREWYIKKCQKGMPYECPLNAIDKCPKYLVSRIKLFEHTTNSKKYLSVWKDDPAWDKLEEFYPKVRRTLVLQGHYYRYFCPEVMYSVFGLYVTDLDDYPFCDKEVPAPGFEGEYVYETFRRIDPLQQRFMDENPLPEKHWMHEYEAITPMHYSQCPIYHYFTAHQVQDLAKIDNGSGEEAIDKDKPPKKLRPDQEAKRKVQALAIELWKQYPELWISEMEKRQEILQIAGRYCKKRTLHGWLAEVAPADKHGPGRHPKQKK